MFGISRNFAPVFGRQIKPYRETLQVLKDCAVDTHQRRGILSRVDHSLQFGALAVAKRDNLRFYNKLNEIWDRVIPWVSLLSKFA